MTRPARISIAGVAVVLSLPAVASCYVGIVVTFLFARLGGYNGTPTDAILKLARLAVHSPLVAGMFAAIIGVALYWAFFARIIVNYARGREISRFLQCYCLVVVILVVAERIRLEMNDEKIILWFGAFSIPHAVALFTLFVLQKSHAGDSSARPGSAAQEKPGVRS